MQALRGRSIAMIFQEPMTSLNPLFTVGDQVAEVLTTHEALSPRAAQARAVELLGKTGIPEPARRARAYAHQLSGGQRPRAMIAMALACRPSLLIADEPTTALDVTIQAQVLELLDELQREYQMAVLFITHDLNLARRFTSRVGVMEHGVLVEIGATEDVLTRPQHPYTRRLVDSRPQREVQALADGRRPVLTGDKLSVEFRVRAPGRFRRLCFRAVAEASLTLARGETLGIVGESGSGKTTLGLTLLRLHEQSGGPVGGTAMFDGRDLLALSKAELLPMRKRIQVVFQNPYASLNPRFTIGQTLLEPMTIHNIGQGAADRDARARALLAKVGLDESAMQKYPHEFSGGQRQRVAIARCLTLSPEVLVLDEAVSALDVSVQAQVLNLLKDLQDELGLTYIFISHDLAVVRFMADDVLVMKDGEVVEQASVAAILDHPEQEYTRRLLSAIPRGYVAAAPA